VVLDSFSRKVVGWALDRTLAARLPIAALEQAIAQRQPPPGLVHHSDRGVQYACGDYAQILQQHHEPTGESLRQRQLRKFYEDAQTGGDLCE
jgi:transposase InsO family protein